MSENSAAEVRPHTPYARVAAIAVGLTAVLAVILLAFSWPAFTSEAKDVQLAIAGPDEPVAAVQAQLESTGDVFEITAVDDRDAAVTGIEERDYVGAIVLGESPELLTASAAGTAGAAVSQLATPLQAALTQQAAAAAQAAGVEAPAVQLTVTDVVPYSDDDPNGSLFASAFFPILFGGMIGGIALSTIIVGSVRRVVGALVYSAIGGIVLTSVLEGWFGSIQGGFWTDSLAFTLSILAIALPIIGFVALIGRAGMAVGPVVMMLFANPISGAQIPSSFLPGAWGTVGQWFPPGASATLLRDLSYFPNADASFPWLVLTGWAVGGTVLALIGHFRTSVSADEKKAAPAVEAVAA